MKLLLDTHALLWFLVNDPKLSATAKTAIEDPAERALAISHQLAGNCPQESAGQAAFARTVRHDVSRRPGGGRHSSVTARTTAHRAVDDSAAAP